MGQRKSVYYCPTRLYPNKYTPIPYPLHVPTRQPSFSQTQKIFSQPHLCHRVTPPKTRHGKTLPHSDIKSTSSTAHCVPSQYPSTGLPQGLLPLQVAMPSDHDRISAANPSSSSFGNWTSGVIGVLTVKSTALVFGSRRKACLSRPMIISRGHRLFMFPGKKSFGSWMNKVSARLLPGGRTRTKKDDRSMKLFFGSAG